MKADCFAEAKQKEKRMQNGCMVCDYSETSQLVGNSISEMLMHAVRQEQFCSM
jgi:hypothetical protein